MTIEAWKQTIENQRHFNEICIKIRTLAITTISAFIGAIGFLVKDLEKISELNILIYGTITAMTTVAWFAFYFMDVGWYHKLLSGSVNHAIKNIEEKNKNEFPELSLSTEIKKTAAKHEKWQYFKEHPSNKLNAFYISGTTIILLPFTCFVVATIIYPLLKDLL